MKRLTREQRSIIERDYLFYTDSQLAAMFGCTNDQVRGYRLKVGLKKPRCSDKASRIDWLVANTLLKDEVIDLMILGYNKTDIARELKSKYQISRWSVGKIINTKIHHSTRMRWERSLLQ
ncbi:MAG: hypothetical protein ACPGUE_14815 [Marinomonas sp.]